MSGHGHDKGHGGEHGGHEEENEESHEEHEDHEHDEGHGNDHGHDDHGHDGHAKHEEHAPKEAAEKKEPEAPKKKAIGEFEIVMLLAIAVFGRLATNNMSLTSIEPIIPIAVYAGLAYGTNAGILVGLFSYPISNLFLPGGVFGIWTFLQAISGAIAGGLAGQGKQADQGSLIRYTLIGTVIFEIALNFPNGELLVWPFSFTHIISNIVFALVIAVIFPKQK